MAGSNARVHARGLEGSWIRAFMDPSVHGSEGSWLKGFKGLGGRVEKGLGLSACSTDIGYVATRSLCSAQYWTR
eukprot:3882394-Rhodomonas_salina.1